MPRLALMLLTILALAPFCAADTYTITLDPAARAEPATGRVILFFITRTEPWWSRRDPMDGPFWDAPQPIASVAVTNLKPGESAAIDGSTFAFPASLDTLDGKIRVQAVLDLDQTERSFAEGPGNLHSDVVEATVSAGQEDGVKLTLNHVIKPPEKVAERDNLKWIAIKSQLLSKHYGRDVYLRAGVALPQGYLDPNSKRTHWPAIYIIPGFGGREELAFEYAMMHQTKGTDELAPQAVDIVLDPESPLGHHGFVDSPANGPRGEALVTELIPYLESRFRLVAKPEARIVTGHSSGGWSSLWLAVRYPEVFGACWSSAPDPIDFSAFQMTNLYEDANLYVDREGSPTPSYRRPGPPIGEMFVCMTVKQEGMMEHALDPLGRSGEQWDTWESMFSPLDPSTGLPKPMFDPLTGAIDKHVVEAWSSHDIARRVTGDWPKYKPIITQRVRLVVGDEDSFHLNRAVESFKARIESLMNGEAWSPGYIRIIKGADHSDLVGKTFMQWNEEMRAYLKEHGFGD